MYSLYMGSWAQIPKCTHRPFQVRTHFIVQFGRALVLFFPGGPALGHPGPGFLETSSCARALQCTFCSSETGDFLPILTAP